ncbi:hypothetical protein [Streptomyces huasconensis]|uniref:hypothetical protein n=1 Tax=Streptomyces huasconensis TaxID=1854574 RepID=UPI0033D20966
MLSVANWTADHHHYRAELYEHAGSAVSPTPVLASLPELPNYWWGELLDSLNALSAVRTERIAVREDYIRRAVPQFTGHSVNAIEWRTAHGDVHWSNVTGPSLKLLDWEGWGAAPLGYDATCLYLHSLHVPDVAHRVWKELADVLDSPASRVGQLVACAEILQAAPRVDFYGELADAVRRHLATLGGL